MAPLHPPLGRRDWSSTERRGERMPCPDMVSWCWTKRYSHLKRSNEPHVKISNVRQMVIGDVSNFDTGWLISLLRY